MTRLLYLLPATAWMILIIILSLISADRIKPYQFDSIIGLDKWVHIFLYAMQIVLLLCGLKDWKVSFKFKMTIGISFSILLGLLMEVLQYFMSAGRNFDIYDIIANIVGVIIGSIIFYSRFNK